MLVVIADIEELGLALSVVGSNEVADDLWQVVFVSHLQPFSDMTDDNLSALNVSQCFVRINARLVFCKINRVGQFPNVMI